MDDNILENTYKKIKYKSLDEFYDKHKNAKCIEVNFKWKDVFEDAWFGWSKFGGEDYIFWFGLTPDGLNPYDTPSYKEFKTKKLFQGKSLDDIWGEIIMF